MPVNATFGSIVHAGIYRQIPPVNATGQPCLKVEYLLPMPAFTKIIVLYNFRYKKLSKSCTQLLRYKEPVPYLPVNASMDNTVF